MRPLLFILLMLAALPTAAQYTTQGKIEYERKVNIHALFDESEDKDWYEKIKASIPKFYISYYNLFFTPEQAIYKPGREVPGAIKTYQGGPATENVVKTDLANQRVVARKAIYEKKFIVTDTARKLQWKMLDEIRTIAGYKCRKAVSKICDSVYIIAFYTESIIPAAGPEMVGGLPGMVLEFAVPRLHTTWTATHVETTIPSATDFDINTKGTRVTQKELYETLQTGLKDWGKTGQRNIWWSML